MMRWLRRAWCVLTGQVVTDEELIDIECGGRQERASAAQRVLAHQAAYDLGIISRRQFRMILTWSPRKEGL